MTTDSKTPFDLSTFAAQEQRRIERLVRAAYGVGGTHAWFRALPRNEQEVKVQEWVDEALHARLVRLGLAEADWQ